MTIADKISSPEHDTATPHLDRFAFFSSAQKGRQKEETGDRADYPTLFVTTVGSRSLC